MYKKNFKIVKADRKRFYEALEKKETNAREISTELGHEVSYISNCFSKHGGIPEAVVRFLQKWYGIEYDEYKPVNPPKAEENKPAASVDTAAIVEALKTALNSYAWQETIARTVRFVLREETTEDMIQKIVQDAVRGILE